VTARAAGLGTEIGPPPRVRAPLAPATSVGRTARRNVLLAGWGSGGDGNRGDDGDRGDAELAIDVTYRGLFDHAQDHIPGMLLIEAARQAALATASDETGVPAAALAVRALTASFTAVAELDLPVECHATRNGDLVNVSMRQGGAPVCAIGARVAVKPGSRERP
jgi:hypothetical protein